ncbi:MAG: serine/threonine-protein kinase [Polyangiaceae bacterium]
MHDRFSLAPDQGTVIAGKYRIGRVLASGGMGMILEGEHEALGQKVAIKYLLPAAAEREDMIGRFLREARAAARIPSDRVARVFDVGTDEDGRPFMVMELLEGQDLGDYMQAHGAIPIGEAVRFILEALEAIVEAHALGIIHRDLKPSNLFVVTKGGAKHIKVLDFGISKVTSESGAPELALTSTKSLLGSPGYMSPEQVRSTKNVDARTDVWALGVILFEMLSAQTAFDGESIGDVFAKIREEDLPPISEFRKDVPAELEAVLASCLARDRKKRIASAAEMRDALKPFAALDVPPQLTALRRVARLTSTTAETVGAIGSRTTLPAPAKSSVPPEPRIAKHSGGTLATWSDEHGGSPRRSKRAAIAIVVAAGAVGGAVVLAFALKSSPSGPNASPGASSETAVTHERTAAPPTSAPTPPAVSVTMGDSAAPFAALSAPHAPPSAAPPPSASPSSGSAPKLLGSAAPHVPRPPVSVKPPEDLGI